MPSVFDAIHAGLGLAAFLFFAFWLVARKGNMTLARRLEALEGRLAELKNAPGEQEYRLERHDLLWYPLLKYSPAEKKILSVTIGVPHCPGCFVQVKVAGNKDFSCPKCAKSFPGSVVDLSVMDSMEKLVRSYFRQRRPEFTA